MINNIKRYGLLIPSGRFLCREMVKIIKSSNKKNKKILEIGSGSGVITDEIIKSMKKMTFCL